MARHAVITGGAGFIGSHLVDRLMEEGTWRVTVIDNFDPFYDRAIKEENVRVHFGDPRFRLVEADVLDDDLEQRIFKEGPDHIDLIVHIAAKAGVRPSIADPVGYHRVNVTGTLKLLELAQRQKVPHFILSSSSSVYGEDPNVPWKERELGLVPISPYAASKIAAEEFARVHSRLHGMRVTILRFFTVYGPRQRPDLAIHKFFRSIRDGRPIQQYGDGSTRRDYTYVTDIINGVRAAMDRHGGSACEVYNLGNSDTVALRDLITAIEDTMGRKAVIEVKPEQPGDVPQTFADVSKAERDLGFVPGTPLRSGLQQFQDWFARQGVGYIGP
ncbi:MAG: GDP-mannose 4,6-dehydratase [Flavobacteriales bacterium]|nr:GDP-mannose 4,6-dehydratase [Flavobacteriales bacterium]MCB9193617.1 GDP-mannose 4,6-dehydratase [Flavobacteriales bacterium]